MLNSFQSSEGRDKLDERYAHWQTVLGELAMVYVVEIENRDGDRATKEYDISNESELFVALERDLANYPSCRVRDAWPKGNRRGSLFAV